MDVSAPEAEPPGHGNAVPLNARADSAVFALRQPPLASRPAKPKPPGHSPRFPIGAATDEFRRRFFPDATKTDWNDWRWQLRARIRSAERLAQIFALSDDERGAVALMKGALPVGITPYYASLMDRENPADPLRRTHIPVGQELHRMPGEADDPLGEDHDAAVPGLVHRYPDRVLFLTTGTCSTYCRYCTRSRMVGDAGGEYAFSRSQWDKALAYIEAHSEIRDVLLSGGDPLTIADEKLDYLLGRLRAIPHVEFVRIGTKVPTVLPMRITKALTRMLRQHHPLWLSIHATHPAELTPEVTEAYGRLADAGIPLGSQTVLLAGINDDVETMRGLVHGLLKRRVKPYYLYQCDPITGSAHFRTPVSKGIAIIEGLRGHTTGYAVPHYVIDAPGGGGKIPLLPEYVVGRDGDDLLLRNFEGGVYRYPDPGGDYGANRTRGER
ncbi:MAG: KamA family radical SAM protein [Alphaproteobacteria bacterium]|nr:KamA family radical SAM protein [Alphaproteobacteria bacterium]MCB9930961.1 KamA family radical SAM protein [Alphaproteobacteria bacterium]